MRMNIAIESTKVAAANTSAIQRAIDFGVARTASEPITGSRIIQVRSLVNITVLSSLHNCGQHKDHCCQNRDAPKETDHVGLHPAGLNVADVAAQRQHKLGRAIDQAINNVGIEGLLDVRESKHTVADQQVVELVHVVFTQQNTMQHAQHCMALHISVDPGKFKTGIQGVGPGEADQCYYNTQPCLPVTHDGKEV